MRVLRALKRSPLALDLYTWLTYKAYVVSRSGVPQTVPWSGLMAQMGADYATLNDLTHAVPWLTSSICEVRGHRNASLNWVVVDVMWLLVEVPPTGARRCQVSRNAVFRPLL